MANADKGWMGGIYYIKNMVYQFLAYPPTSEAFQIYIYLEDIIMDEFAFCSQYKNVFFIRKKVSRFEKADFHIAKTYTTLKLMSLVLIKGIDYIYPYFSHYSFLQKKSISWIADFQHYYYQQYFTEKEYQERTDYFSEIARCHNKLILSSKDSYHTYKMLYPNNLKNVYIVPFVSALDKGLILHDNSVEIFSKYDLHNNNYFLVSNQFWQHKNHKIIIDALKTLQHEGHHELIVVCTGLAKDYRNMDYFNGLLEIIRQSNLENNIKILGLIPREHQLQIMKNAIAVIQPSLFEGWGTAVEDAKRMGKIIVMSDIEVHKEQAYENSILYKKNSSSQLALILLELWNKYVDKKKVFCYQSGKEQEYGKLFYEAIQDSIS